MKRSAEEAFSTVAPSPSPLPPPPPRTPTAAFQPSAAAMLDPKAYFAQWQQQSLAYGQGAVPAAPVVPGGGFVEPSSSSSPMKSEVQQQVEAASAVKCAAIVKEKGMNFTSAVAIEALRTMATKSSFKLREELLRQPHVRKLCERVVKIVSAPPAGLSVEQLTWAGWSLVRFPKEVLEDAGSSLGSLARSLGRASPSAWNADTASKALWSLAKADVIAQHKLLVSQVVQEFIRDLGRRVMELSHEALVNMLWAVAVARRHKHAGDHPTVHMEANDELLFSYASKRISSEIDSIDARLLAELAHTHSEGGIKNAALFKAMCPKILAKQKEIGEKEMGRAIKAYTRFMLPLKEEPQGFRTMAVVQKGDFIRPSDKPKKEGRKTFDHPVALYPKTQVHARG